MNKTSDEARIPVSYRSRRTLTLPKLAESDRPDPAELARMRERLASERRRLPARG